MVDDYSASQQGAYASTYENKRTSHAIPIVCKEDTNLPKDKDGNPISVERQEEIIRQAVQIARKRTQPLVLTLQRDFHKKEDLTKKVTVA